MRSTERALLHGQVNELVAGSSVRTSVDAAPSEDGQQRRPSLATGSGARRLGLVRPHPALTAQRPVPVRRTGPPLCLCDAARLAQLHLSCLLRPLACRLHRLCPPVPHSEGCCCAA